MGLRGRAFLRQRIGPEAINFVRGRGKRGKRCQHDNSHEQVGALVHRDFGAQIKQLGASGGKLSSRTHPDLTRLTIPVAWNGGVSLTCRS
jgi:hypothetical protein